MFRCSSLSVIDMLLVDRKYRRYPVAPAYGMVFSPQNTSSGNGQIPGWCFILDTSGYGLRAIIIAETGRPAAETTSYCDLSS